MKNASPVTRSSFTRARSGTGTSWAPPEAPELKLVAPESVTLARSGSSAPSASFTVKLKFGNTTRSDLDPSGSSGTSALPFVSLTAVPAASCRTGSLSSFSYDPATLRPNPMEAVISVTSPTPDAPADFTCAFTASVLRSGETVPFMTAVKTVTVKAPRAAAAAAAPVVTAVIINPPAGTGLTPPVNENFVLGVTPGRTYTLRVFLDGGSAAADPRAEDNAACTKTPMNPTNGASLGPPQSLSVDSSSGISAGQFTFDPPDDTPGKFKIECAAGAPLDRKRAEFTAWVFRPSADNSKIYSLGGSVNTWDAAVTACGTMRDGGYNDWTLPTKAFLETNKATWCNYDTGTTSCLNMPTGTGQDKHWATETYPTDTTKAWIVRGGGGTTVTAFKTTINGYRCIRSAP